MQVKRMMNQAKGITQTGTNDVTPKKAISEIRWQWRLNKYRTRDNSIMYIM